MTTSDSIDRVFSHALATVRRLPRTGSSRPPPAARLRLYGLYKQSMEGDVDAILPRPTLPPPSPHQQGFTATDDTAHDQQAGAATGTTQHQQEANKGSGSALTRYGSRQLRTREAQAEIEKWDAWHACKGMSQTAAKKAYIRTLIETMKEYASGTQESRELVGELEFVWRQISRKGSRGGKGGDSDGQDDNDDDDDDDDDEHDDDGYQDTEEDSPRRSGLVQLGQGRRGLRGHSSGKMTLLSPVGQSEAEHDGGDGNDGGDGGGSIVANEEVGLEDRSASPSGRMRNSSSNNNNNHNNSVSVGRNANNPNNGSNNNADGNDPWRHSVEAHLRHLSTEIAALREQLSSHYLLAPSGYSPYSYQHLTFRWRIWYKVLAWVRWAVSVVVRQLLIQLCLLGFAILYGRWKGDRRVELWLRQRLNAAWSWVSRLSSSRLSSSRLSSSSSRLSSSSSSSADYWPWLKKRITFG